MLPLLGAVARGGVGLLGSVLGTGLRVGGGIAKTALNIGSKVAGLGARAVSGGARALGIGGGATGAAAAGGRQTAQQVIPKQGQTVATTKPNQVKQAKQVADKATSDTTSKIIKEAKDTSRKSEKSSKGATSILSKIQMILDTINKKVSDVVRAITSEQKRDQRKGLESKVESEREGDKQAAAVPKQSIAERGKKMMKKTGGFISSVLGLIFKYFLVKIGTLALFPELAGQFKEFENNIVGFFKNGFSALKKLFTGDFEGAKKDGKAAFDNLLGVLKGVAKFASGLVDKVLKFFGFKELNLFEKADKKIEDIKKGLDEDLGEEGEGKSFLEKIFRKLEIMLVDMFAVLKEFLSPGNLWAMFRKSGKLEDIDEDEKKELGSYNIDRKVKNVKFKAFQKAKDEGRISKNESMRSLQLKMENNRATEAEQQAYNEIISAGDEERTRVESEIKAKYDKKREDAQIPFFKKENVEKRKQKEEERKQRRLERDAEKKIKQKASGKEIDEASAQQKASINVVNAPATVNKGGDSVSSTTNVSGGGSAGNTTNQERSAFSLQTTYAN